MPIHDRALVHRSVEIDDSNDVGPNVVIEEGVTIGRENRILANAYLCRGTTIGDRNIIHMSAVIGNEPQDLAYEGQPTFTRIGNDNTIREFVSIHRGTKEGSETVIGDGCFLMANTHVAHNCALGDGVIMVNGSGIAGYVAVGDGAFISGICVFHQFVRVGRLAMISGGSVLNQDAPPFLLLSGRPAEATGLNIVGIRRAGLDAETRKHLQEAYRVLYRSDLPIGEAVARLRTDPTPEVQHLGDFVAESRRGICKGGRGK